MAELEVVSGGSVAGSTRAVAGSTRAMAGPTPPVAGPVRALGRWGVLGLLPRWLGEQVAAGGRGETWPDVPPVPAPVRRTRSDDDAPSLSIGLRPTAAALRRTIDAWRATERDLARPAIDGRERARLQEEFDVLRATHHRLFLEVSLPSRFQGVETALG